MLMLNSTSHLVPCLAPHVKLNFSHGFSPCEQDISKNGDLSLCMWRLKNFNRWLLFDDDQRTNLYDVMKHVLFDYLQLKTFNCNTWTLEVYANSNIKML